MKRINARNLAAALTSLGADVESALLELAAVSPTLDSKVRRALFYHNELPKLRNVPDGYGDNLLFVDNRLSRPVCAMHAVDQVTRVLDDERVVQYLESKFSEYNVEVLYV